MSPLVILTRRHLLNTAESPDAEPVEVSLQSEFVLVLAAILCALICLSGLVAVARCAWLRRSLTGYSREAAAANKGLKKKVLQALPVFTYGGAESEHAEKFASSECAICLGEFVHGDQIRVLPQCGHGFHVACIDTWLGSHSSCPSCRQILVVARCLKCGQHATLAGGGDHHSVNATTSSTINNCNNNNDNSFLP